MYKIGALAKAAGVNVETVRYYERVGLIQQPPTPPSGYREYPASTLGQIRFIKRAQALGFTLGEISQLLEIDEGQCGQVQHMAEDKLEDIRCKMNDLKRLSKALKHLVDQCAVTSKNAPCPIIHALIDPD